MSLSQKDRLFLSIKHIALGCINYLFKSKPEFYNDRFSICKECNEINLLLFCKSCRCFTPAKCAYKGEYCEEWREES